MRETRRLFWLILCVVMALPAMAGLNDGLILHYDFESFNGATIQDRSGNLNDGLVNNASPISGTPSGNGYEFDGLTSYIEVPGNASMGVSNVSVTAWVRPNNLAVGLANNNILFDTMDFQGTSGGFGFGLGREYDLAVGLRTSSGTGHSFIAPNVFGPIDTGKWHFVAFSHSYSDGVHSVAIFLDGEAVAQLSQPGSPLAYAGQPGFVGSNYEGRARGYGFHREFNGAVADLRVYARTLSDEEVTSLYRSVKEEFLVIHYDFDGFSGGVVVDRTTNRNDGVSHNLSAFDDAEAGPAVHFNGATSFVEVPGSASLALTNYTIAIQMRPDDLGSSSAQVLFQSMDFVHGRGGIGVGTIGPYALGAGARMAVGDVGATPPPFWSEQDNGRWGLLVYTHEFDDGVHEFAFYWNGIEVYRTTAFHAMPPAYDGQPAFIGTGYEGLARGFSFKREYSGAMADFRLYSRALSAREVFDLAGRTPDAVLFQAVEICWPAVSGSRYRVEGASSLNSDEWLPVGEDVIATNSFPCVFDSSRLAPSRVYRIRELTDEE